MLAANIERLLDERHGELLEFWTCGGPMPEASVEAHCDIVYSLFLTGRHGDIAEQSIERFAAWLREFSLPGWVPENGQEPILVHACAYAFGALNLISDDPAPLYETVLDGRETDLDAIIDPDTLRPVFPSKWAHHNWRVSHWIGGIPSMILSLARSGYSHAALYADLIEPVRNATDAYIDPRTGLLRAYRSDLLQAVFRRLYALRHDPVLGDIGGVAHILWVDHALGRPYVAIEALLTQSRFLFYRAAPFMENVPYCLDFDVVQIVRTALDKTDAERGADASRARAMMADIEDFFASPVPEDYTLHKVPGALATYHECALIAERDISNELGTRPLDVISRAYWL